MAEEWAIWREKRERCQAIFEEVKAVLCPRCQESSFWMIGVTNLDCHEKCSRDYMTAVEECWLLEDASEPYITGYLDMLATSARVFLTARSDLKLDTAELYKVVGGGSEAPDAVGDSRDAVPAREHRPGPKETSV